MTLTAGYNQLVPQQSGAYALRIYTGTNPAATGVEFSETVPVGKVWELLAVSAQLVTDANAANRAPSLKITDGTNLIFQSGSQTAIPASQNLRLSWSPAGLSSAINISSGITMLIPEIMVGPGFVISSSTLLIQATDDWSSPVFYVKEYTL